MLSKLLERIASTGIVARSARMKAELVGRLEAECGNDTSCLRAGWAEADRMAASYDEVLTLIHYPEMTKEKADALAQAVLDLAPGVSNASALYELVTGKTATGDEANRFFAGIGLVPVFGGILKKGGQAIHVFAEADKALAVAKVGGKGGVAAKGAASGPKVTIKDHYDHHLNMVDDIKDQLSSQGFRVSEKENIFRQFLWHWSL
ncbi:hypothetical protein D3C87_1414130 [compost metagenome]